MEVVMNTEQKCKPTSDFNVLYCIVLSSHTLVAGPRMACFTVQQQPKWNSSR
jgi:hypothetical protein